MERSKLRSASRSFVRSISEGEWNRSVEDAKELVSSTREEATRTGTKRKDSWKISDAFEREWYRSFENDGCYDAWNGRRRRSLSFVGNDAIERWIEEIRRASERHQDRLDLSFPKSGNGLVLILDAKHVWKARILLERDENIPRKKKMKRLELYDREETLHLFPVVQGPSKRRILRDLSRKIQRDKKRKNEDEDPLRRTLDRLVGLVDVWKLPCRICGRILSTKSVDLPLERDEDGCPLHSGCVSDRMDGDGSMEHVNITTR